MPIDPDILPTFLQEAAGYVETLRRPDSRIGALHQAAHSLKGAASMLGLDSISNLARQLEQQLRQGRSHGLQQALESIEAQLARLRQTPDLDPEPQPLTQGEAQERSVLDEDWDPATARLLRDLFVDEAAEHMEAITTAVHQLRRSPTDLQPLQEMLRKTHTLKGSASTVGLPRIGEAAHLFESQLVALQRDGVLRAGAVSQLHLASSMLQEMAEAARTSDASTSQLEQLRSCLGSISDADRRSHEIRSEVSRTVTLPEARPRETKANGPDNRTGPRRHDDTLRVRVDVSQLDHLMNTVGELVIQRTRIEQRLGEIKGLARDMSLSRQALHSALADTDEVANPAFLRIREVDVEIADAVANLERAATVLEEDSEALRRSTHTLQESLTQVRMMPIRWLHARLQRPMRQLAAAQDKLVELTTDDESTEMDRLVFERITDPLIHLIRNAVAHGIETPDARAAMGKSPEGLIRVNARQKGDLVVVDVVDDGAGMDPARLRATLKQRGEPVELVDRLTDGEVLESIFISGFTTREHVDQLSGRGMGLDVVRRNISEMGGEIQVTSTPGQGTRFTIRMPIATAIIQALLFKVGEPVYAVPVGYVLETCFVNPATDLRQDEHGVTHVLARGQWIPLLQLHQILGGDPPLPASEGDRRPARLPVIVLVYGETRFAISCRRVVGPREIVLKQLGPLLAGLPLFSSATVSGSSKVQFVLDAAALARLVRSGRPTKAVIQPGNNVQRILVVDDSRSVRAAMSHILHMAGFAVDVAADGWEAWERLQTEHYDLLLTDLEMPRLHGYELIARCRSSSRFAQLPILVLSSRSASRNQQQAMARGASGFLAKPIHRALVLQKVRELADA